MIHLDSELVLPLVDSDDNILSDPYVFVNHQFGSVLRWRLTVPKNNAIIIYQEDDRWFG